MHSHGAWVAAGRPTPGSIPYRNLEGTYKSWASTGYGTHGVHYQNLQSIYAHASYAKYTRFGDSSTSILRPSSTPDRDSAPRPKPSSPPKPTQRFVSAELKRLQERKVSSQDVKIVIKPTEPLEDVGMAVPPPFPLLALSPQPPAKKEKSSLSSLSCFASSTKQSKIIGPAGGTPTLRRVGAGPDHGGNVPKSSLDHAVQGLVHAADISVIKAYEMIEKLVAEKMTDASLHEYASKLGGPKGTYHALRETLGFIETMRDRIQKELAAMKSHHDAPNPTPSSIITTEGIVRYFQQQLLEATPGKRYKIR